MSGLLFLALLLHQEEEALDLMVFFFNKLSVHSLRCCKGNLLVLLCKSAVCESII
ncbi:hypothetical protein O6H91_01G000200 [Diphasiastrum complanatum]|uniref:Uncharacterized protein n=1 Tax=Diphasiastrum complanatum TaxID=34168 RepID=A0ACC2EME9_DIPCM|nr:hypothetical protein O6H91_01G000200 [Diphasiastrum complanatum]